MKAVAGFILLFFLPSFLFAESLKDLELAPDNTQKVKTLKINSLSDLQKLTPQDSVSVIQKRYMPKTFRGEFNLSVSTVINHTFFYLGGASAKTGFFIREDHGFGVEGFALLPPIFKMVATDMIGQPNEIVPLSIILTKFYGGVYYKWSPIFGKFAVLNRTIVYFDMYMTLGAGMNWVLDGVDVIDEHFKRTCQELQNKESGQVKGACQELQNKESGPVLSADKFPAFNLGLGQMFSLTQDWAFNWELKWFLTVVQYENGNRYTPWDINFSIGMNYYFPGAKYR
ncbi:MAG: hypothetical protein OXN83_02775 [Oligoflexia bacterium]|nr:hypothetical protein [Oligoflexia bacterium]